MDSIYAKFLLILNLFLAVSCDDFPNTPELIDKFRTMGVGLADPSYTYSTDSTPVTAALSFYFATPSDASITADNVEVDSQTIELTFSAPVLVEAKATLNIYKVDATANIPVESALIFNPAEEDTATVSYAAIFLQGSEEERVFGKIRIYRPTVASSSEVTTPTATILEPVDGDSVSGSIELSGEVGNKIVESYRSSWLVSSGTIEKFRDREAEWVDAKKGSQTVIFTVRGLDSFNFNYTAIDVTVN